MRAAKVSPGATVVYLRTFDSECDCGYWSCRCTTAIAAEDAIRLGLELLLKSLIPLVRAVWIWLRRR